MSFSCRENSKNEKKRKKIFRKQNNEKTRRKYKQRQKKHTHKRDIQRTIPKVKRGKTGRENIHKIQKNHSFNSVKKQYRQIQCANGQHKIQIQTINTQSKTINSMRENITQSRKSRKKEELYYGNISILCTKQFQF